MNPKEKYVTLPMDIFIQLWRLIGQCEGVMLTYNVRDTEMFKELSKTMEAAFRAASGE